ncbi:MAG: K(+)/H(+) antiporter subunit KhtU [Acidimicrobiales bacterium]|nr:K(+)/H(+) antiporter subunit KhtU [Acidimicrobiales bacterium]
MSNELIAVGGALITAALLARLGRRIGFPTIPLFMLAGVVFGPHTPGLDLVEDPGDLGLLATLGLILLLFHLGLEFNISGLTSGGRKLLGTGALYLALNMTGGLLFALALGWGVAEAFVIAGAVGISSSAIVTKLVTELRRLANPETRVILGIIVVEDLFLAVYLAALQPLLGDADSLVSAIGEFAVALGFLVVLAVIARWGATAVGRLVPTDDDELLTVSFVGLAVLVAGIASELGVSDAIGAFMIGLIVAETAAAERISRLVLPLRDTFAAVFFFAFGLSIDPADLGSVTAVVAGAVVLTLILNVVAGLITARWYKFSRVAALNISFTTLGRGELSLILASLAIAAGLDERIAPLIGAYVLILAVVGPLLSSRSTAIAKRIPQRAP